MQTLGSAREAQPHHGGHFRSFYLNATESPEGSRSVQCDYKASSLSKTLSFFLRNI
jgi:hypothetical protein